MATNKEIHQCLLCKIEMIQQPGVYGLFKYLKEADSKGSHIDFEKPIEVAVYYCPHCGRMDLTAA